MLMWYSCWSTGFFHIIDVPERGRKEGGEARARARGKKRHTAKASAARERNERDDKSKPATRPRGKEMERGKMRKEERVFVRDCQIMSVTFLVFFSRLHPRGDGAQHGPKLVHQDNGREDAGGWMDGGQGRAGWDGSGVAKGSGRQGGQCGALRVAACVAVCVTVCVHFDRMVIPLSFSIAFESMTRLLLLSMRLATAERSRQSTRVVLPAVRGQHTGEQRQGAVRQRRVVCASIIILTLHGRAASHPSCALLLLLPSLCRPYRGRRAR